MLDCHNKAITHEAYSTVVSQLQREDAERIKFVVKRGMTMTTMTLSSQEFSQDMSNAKKAVSHGPVFITDEGKAAYVLLSIEEYKRITDEYSSIADIFGSPAGVEDIEIEFPHSRELMRPADFS
jgi:hypothetical protein